MVKRCGFGTAYIFRNVGLGRAAGGLMLRLYEGGAAAFDLLMLHQNQVDLVGAAFIVNLGSAHVLGRCFASYP